MRLVKLTSLERGKSFFALNKQITLIDSFVAVDSDEYLTVITEDGPIDFPIDLYVRVFD